MKSEPIYLEAAPLEWLSQPDNQQRLRQMLARNRDRLFGNSGGYASQKAVPSTERRDDQHREE